MKSHNAKNFVNFRIIILVVSFVILVTATVLIINYSNFSAYCVGFLTALTLYGIEIKVRRPKDDLLVRDRNSNQ